MMNYMQDILCEIKARPSMYIYECSLENLYAFINGYMYQKFQENDNIPEFYSGFQNYIEQKYDVKTGQHWIKIINFYSKNEREAWEEFFDCLEHFTIKNEEA